MNYLEREKGVDVLRVEPRSISSGRNVCQDSRTHAVNISAEYEYNKYKIQGWHGMRSKVQRLLHT